jgi:hypothetical protein
VRDPLKRSVVAIQEGEKLTEKVELEYLAQLFSQFLHNSDRYLWVKGHGVSYEGVCGRHGYDVSHDDGS